MPPHTHGQAETLITPLEGRMLLTSGEQQVTLELRMLSVIAVGEQVGVENAATELASLLAVFAPADFIRTPASWPTVNAADERRGQGSSQLGASCRFRHAIAEYADLTHPARTPAASPPHRRR